MEILPAIVGAASLGVNVHAIVALVRGLRASNAADVKRHARRCAWSVAGCVLLMGGATAASLLSAPSGGKPEERASQVAMAISDAMNSAAFTLFVVLLPAAAAVLLYVRAARRASATAV